MQKLFGSRTVPDLGTVTTSIAALTDASTVERTWGLLSVTPSRKDEFYGPNFTWIEYYRVRNWLHGVAIHWGLMMGTFLLALFRPLRTLVGKFVHQPGQGPARSSIRHESIEYRGIATPDNGSKGSQKAFCKASFSGSMYYCEYHPLTRPSK